MLHSTYCGEDAVWRLPVGGFSRLLDLSFFSTTSDLFCHLAAFRGMDR